MSVNRLKSTTIFGELIVQDISGNNANTVLNRDLSVTGKIKTPKIESPFNSLVNLSFLSSFPTSAVNDQNSGIGWFWNQSGGQGETDLILYGQGGEGGLALYVANNSIAPYLFCRLYPSLISFSTTPQFPTSNTIGAIGATTSYVNNVLGSYLTTSTATSTYQTIANMSNYVTSSNASATYQTLNNALNNATSTYSVANSANLYYNTAYINNTLLSYQPKSDMTNYLTTASATGLYQTVANMSNYLTTSSASSTHQLIQNMYIKYE